MAASKPQRRSRSSANPSVSVLTATIDGRGDFLREASWSVKGQTFRDREHLVLQDSERAGCAGTMNKLAGEAQGKWLLLLADDDVLLPRCLELLVGAARDGAIVYSPPLVWGESEAPFWGQPPNIPALALIPASVWRSCGGYDERLKEQEDMHFFQRALELGVPFVRYDEQPTWVYRFWGGNKSRNGGVAG